MPPAQTRLSTFLREIHRRNVWRALGIFIGGGWGVLQVVDLFIERGFAPEWVFSGALIALALGLPVVLATAWIQGNRSEWEDRDGDDGAAFLEQLTWKRAILGGVLSFAFLGFATSVYMVMRVAGIGAPATLTAQGLFDAGGQIVLADFGSTVEESAPGDLITEALRIDFAESPAFDLLPQSQVAAMRGLMLIEPDAPLDEGSAREVAVRTGSAAVVSGEVRGLGAGFVITSRVIEAESGNALASFRVTAADEAELLEAMDELGRRMRGKIGESLRSVAASPPLPLHTTTSLEALKKVAYVRSRIDRGAITATVAQQLVREAIALDSTFASAHQYLAILINNLGGDREVGAAASAAAFRHRERLPERERLALEAFYFKTTVGDVEASNRVYRRIAELDSLNPVPWVNLADNLMYAGDYDEAVRALRQVPFWEAGPYRFNLLASLAGRMQLEEAVVAADSGGLAAPDDPYWGPVTGMLLSNFDLPERGRDAVLASFLPEGAPAAAYHYALAQADFVQGRLEPGRGHMEVAMAAWEEFGSESDVIHWGLALPWVSVLYERDLERATADLSALMERVEWEGLSPYNRNYPLIALTYALIGDTTAVADLSERFDAEVPAFGNPYGVSRMELALGLAAVEAHGEAGVEDLEAGAAALRCVRCADLFLGHGYEAAGRVDEAIGAYERFIGSRFFTFTEVETKMFVPVAYERLGLLYEQRGDRVRAEEMLERVEVLWTEADEPLRSRVANALGRLKEGR